MTPRTKVSVEKGQAHTPGPWTQSPQLSEIVDRDGRRVARAYPLHDGIDNDAREVEAEANARLIAAAPDLLATLKNLMSSNGGGSKECGHEFTCICPWDAAMAAIKKAEGR